MHNAPNTFAGTLKSLTRSDVAAEVVVSVGEFEFVSMIPYSSAQAIGLKLGDKVSILIKATEVLLDK
jgi:molybdopterin-binding protein